MSELGPWQRNYHAQMYISTLSTVKKKMFPSGNRPWLTENTGLGNYHNRTICHGTRVNASIIYTNSAVGDECKLSFGKM